MMHSCNWLWQELEKLDAIATRPSVQEELAAKFSRAGWSDAEGYPAASADGSIDFTAPDAQKASIAADADVMSSCFGSSLCCADAKHYGSHTYRPC